MLLDETWELLTFRKEIKGKEVLCYKIKIEYSTNYVAGQFVDKDNLKIIDIALPCASLPGLTYLNHKNKMFNYKSEFIREMIARNKIFVTRVKFMFSKDQDKQWGSWL